MTYPGGAVSEVVADAAVVVPDGSEDSLYEECLGLSRDESRAAAVRRPGSGSSRIDV